MTNLEPVENCLKYNENLHNMLMILVKSYAQTIIN